MRQMRGANLGLVLLAAVVVAGCEHSSGEAGATGTTTATATATAAVTATATSTAAAAASASAKAEAEEAAAAEEAGGELRRHHRHHHHGGVAMFIHMAIDSLGLDADKKAKVEKIQTDLHAKMAPAREAGRNVLTIVADGVAAGKIDDAKLKDALAKQDKAAGQVHAAVSDALNQLHEALSPAERAALVDKVKAHAEVWKKVSHEEEHGAHEKGTHLGHLKEQLGLTADQVEKISAALKKDAPPKPDLKDVDAHLKAFEEAFVGEKFDAKTLKTADAANTAISKTGTGRMVRFYTIVTPLLTPEQRTKLAEHLRERLNDPHGSK